MPPGSESAQGKERGREIFMDGVHQQADAGRIYGEGIDKWS